MLKGMPVVTNIKIVETEGRQKSAIILEKMRQVHNKKSRDKECH